MVERRPGSGLRRQVVRGNRDHGGGVGNASPEPKGRSRARESRSVGYREVTPTSRWDAAARIRTWEPLRDETLNLAPFPSLATAAQVQSSERLNMFASNGRLERTNGPTISGFHRQKNR